MAKKKPAKKKAQRKLFVEVKPYKRAAGVKKHTRKLPKKK